MVIGIDISQVVYKGTGVGTYVSEIVRSLIQQKPEYSYVLFGSSLRQREAIQTYINSVKRYGRNIKSVILPLPPSLLHVIWNVLHIIPITWITGKLDVFWSSDWTQPPLEKCVGITTIHDLSFLLYPKSFTRKIITVQKKRLYWAKRECRMFLCDSHATKKDVIKYLQIPDNKCIVVYPGLQ